MAYDMAGTADCTRKTLLQTAWSLVEERGVSGVTLAEIAARAGVSRQAVYLHFGNRAGLLIGMVRHRDATSIKARKMIRVAKGPPCLKTLDRFVRLWFEYVAEILPVARAIEAASSSDDDAAEAWRDRMETLRTLIREIVDGLADSRQLSARWTRDEATDWFWCRTHIDVWRQLVADRGWRAKAVADCVIQSLWSDLAGDGKMDAIPVLPP